MEDTLANQVLDWDVAHTYTCTDICKKCDP
jgi:hypothetical protein